MSAEDVARFEAIAGNTLSELGYERATSGAGLGGRIASGRARLVVAAQDAVRNSRRRRKTARLLSATKDVPRTGRSTNEHEEQR